MLSALLSPLNREADPLISRLGVGDAGPHPGASEHSRPKTGRLAAGHSRAFHFHQKKFTTPGSTLCATRTSRQRNNNIQVPPEKSLPPPAFRPHVVCNAHFPPKLQQFCFSSKQHTIIRKSLTGPRLTHTGSKAQAEYVQVVLNSSARLSIRKSTHWAKTHIQAAKHRQSMCKLYVTTVLSY